MFMIRHFSNGPRNAESFVNIPLFDPVSKNLKTRCSATGFPVLVSPRSDREAVGIRGFRLKLVPVRAGNKAVA